MKLIWATRGKAWGFRFLLNGGLADPLATYERAFATAGGEVTFCQRTADGLALRFLDPEGRKDDAGRPIPHNCVILDADATDITSVEDAISEVWPLIAEAYEQVWDASQAPATGVIAPTVDAKLAQTP